MAKRFLLVIVCASFGLGALPLDSEGFNYSKKKPIEKHDVVPRSQPGRYPSAQNRNLKENRPLLPTNPKSQIKYKHR